MKNYLRRLAVCLAGVLIGTTANAAIYNIPNGAVAPAAGNDGICSMYEAIFIINNNLPNPDCPNPAQDGSDVINLASGGFYRAVSDNGIDPPAAGFQTINVGVTIEGNGATIFRDANLPDASALSFGGVGTTITLRDLIFDDFQSAPAILFQDGTGTLQLERLTSLTSNYFLQADEGQLVVVSQVAVANAGTAALALGPAMAMVERSSFLDSQNAIFVTSAQSIIQIRDVTMDGNVFGIENSVDSPNVTIGNTIIANTAQVGCSGSVGSADNNLVEDGFCGLTGGNDLEFVPAQLQAPAPGQTFRAPLQGSPALDSSSTCLAADQIGTARPQDSSGGTSPVCDRGAIEVLPPPGSDVSVTLSANPTSVVAGNPVTFTMTVTSNGPDDPVSAVLNAPFSLANASWSCSDNPPFSSCSNPSGLGNINQNVSFSGGPASVVFQLTGTVDPMAFGQDTAFANVNSANDQNNGNNFASADINILPAPVTTDLSVTKTVDRTTAAPGDTLNYTVEVVNPSASLITGLRLLDQVPVGLDGFTWTCEDNLGGPCETPAGSGNIDMQMDLAANSSVIFSISGNIATSAVNLVRNTARIFAPGYVNDTDQSNDFQSVVTFLPVPVDLAISKDDGVDNIGPGQLLQYTITVSNLGQQAVSNATVSDIVPPEIDSPSWTCSVVGTGSCSASGNGNIQDTVDLDIGSSLVYTLSGVVSSGMNGVISNTATVSLPPGVTDGNPANNSATDETTVEISTDLSISKSDGLAQANSGDLLTYVIEVSNTGTLPVEGALVEDMLPSQLQDASWFCEPQGPAECGGSGTGSISDTVSLAPGAQVRYVLTATIARDFWGSLSNTATVQLADGPDANPADNTSTDLTLVERVFDLSISKTDGRETAVSGDSLSYRIEVRNAGTRPIFGARVQDVIPPELLDVSWTCQRSRGLCTAAGNGDIDDSVSLLLDGLLVYTVTGRIDPDFEGEVLNTATVSMPADKVDATPDNNTAFDATLVTASNELLILPLDDRLPDGFAGVPYITELNVVGGVEPLAIDINGLPQGLQASIDERSIFIDGTPLRSGDFNISVSAADAADNPQSTSRVFRLVVLDDLFITPESLSPAQVSVPYSAAVEVFNGVPPYQLSAAGLPPGLAFNGLNLVGTPVMAGSYVISVSAIDSVGNLGDQDISIEVLGPGMAFADATLADGVVGTSYGAQLNAMSAATPITYVANGATPPGLSLAPTGFLNGVPTQAGSFSFGATATDAGGASLSATISVTINADGLITQETVFPNGLVGRPYLAPTAVAGGNAPYECVLIDGQLPPGLTLQGCNTGIDGSPGQAGSYSFVLGVLDGQDPPNTLEVPARISISAETRIPEGQAPELDEQPPINRRVPELATDQPSAGREDESLQSLAVDGFGNRYLVGYAWNGSNYDIRLLKYGVSGGLVWDQVYDSGSDDFAYAVTINPADQSVLVGGYSQNGVNFEAVLVRYDTSGVQQWAVVNSSGARVKAYYGLAAGAEGIFAVGERFNGSNFDALVARYDNQGNLVWENVRDSGDTETAYAAALAPGVGGTRLFMAGGQGQGAGRSGFVEEVDIAGGANSAFASIAGNQVLALASDNSGLLAGGATAGDDWTVTALTASGATRWSTTITQGQRLRGLARDAEGYVYSVGNGGGGDGLLVLLDADGNIAQSLDFDAGGNDVFNALVIGPEGLLTIAGQSTTAQGTRFLLLDLDTGKAY